MIESPTLSSMKMSITAIIPLYNKHSSIERAIGSILAQTVPVSEILIVDDGSTDGGGEVAARVKDPRICVIRQANGGESAARNRGIAGANGELIAFLDADDTWEPHFIAEIIELASAYPEAAVYAAAIQKYDEGGNFDTSGPEGCERFASADRLLDFFAALASRQYPLSSSSVVIPRARLQQCGPFDTTLKLGADTDMWVRLAAVGPIYFSSKVSATYFLDAENRSTARPDFWDRRVDWVAKMTSKIPGLGLASRDHRNLTNFCSFLLYEAENSGHLSDSGYRSVVSHLGVMTPKHRSLRLLRGVTGR